MAVKVDVAGDVDDAVSQGPDFPPDVPSVDQSYSKSAGDLDVWLGVLRRPRTVHGAVRSLNAEIPQASGLSHDPSDVCFP